MYRSYFYNKGLFGFIVNNVELRNVGVEKSILIFYNFEGTVVDIRNFNLELLGKY